MAARLAQGTAVSYKGRLCTVVLPAPSITVVGSFDGDEIVYFDVPTSELTPVHSRAFKIKERALVSTPLPQCSHSFMDVVRIEEIDWGSSLRYYVTGAQGSEWMYEFELDFIPSSKLTSRWNI